MKFLKLYHKHFYTKIHPQIVVYWIFVVDLDFLEVLSEGMEKVLMVRGGGREVITIYS